MRTEPRLGSSELIELAERHSAHNYHPLPVVVAEAEGAWVTDVDGKRYLDMLAAYSALNFGHRHPDLVRAAREQLDRVTLTSRAFHHDLFGPFTRGFVSVPFGDVDALAAALEDPDVVGFLVEPIQGEAGVRIPPDGYLTEARRQCSKRNVLLLADEIQAGIG